MRGGLHAKFLLSVVPVFVLASGAGLSWLAEHGARRHLDELTARVGNHAAQVAAVVGRPGVLEDEATASRVLATLLADRAVQCAELTVAGPDARRLLAPRGVGCLGQDPGERLELSVAAPSHAALAVRFSTRELVEARAARREFSLLVVALGFVLAVGSSAAGFHWTVGAPLRRLLDAIRETSASGRFALVDRVGADEIGRVAEAFNAMQLGLRSKGERLSAALEELAEQNARFDAALKNMSQGLCMLDADRRVAVCNERFAQVYGLAPGLARPGAPVLDLLAPHGAAFGGLGDGVGSALGSLLDAGVCATVQADLIDGRTVAVSCGPMPGGGWVTTHEDVTERRRAEARLAHMARHDALTDLGNRVLFREELERALLRLGRGGGDAAVLCLDLDRFKAVNDALGHAAGDALLRAVADRLRSCLRGADAAARLGGDEFAVVQVGAAQPAGAAALARRLVEAIGAPYDIDGHRVVVGTSVGVALAPQDAADVEGLTRRADVALYRAKAGGRGSFRFFGADTAERAALDAVSSFAAARGEIVPTSSRWSGSTTGG